MNKDNIEIILVSISGEDKPGVTASLTAILARYDAAILDIGQADIHHTLSLGILFRTTPEVAGTILKELLFKASELGVTIRFSPVSVEEYEDWVSRQGRHRWIITILGRKISAHQIALVAEEIALQKLNIDGIVRLTGRPQLVEEFDSKSKMCIEFSVRGTPADYERMQQRFMQISSQEEFDISMQADDIYRRSRRLVCFDMDSTLIETEVIDELADRAGVGPQVRAITESAMRGEIDFRESFRRRVDIKL